VRFLPSRSNRKTFGKIAEEYDLVYFGTVDPEIDTEYKIVKGLTLSPHIRDENYTTGNVYDYEVAFLQRSKQVPVRSGRRTNRTWTILQVQLDVTDLPRMLIDGRTRTNEYGALLASTQRWQEVGWQHFSHPAFSESFALYCRPESIMQISQLIDVETQTMLASHFTQFDYEIFDHKLIVYATNAKINLQTLDHMLRVGLWLARRLDATVVSDN